MPFGLLGKYAWDLRKELKNAYGRMPEHSNDGGFFQFMQDFVVDPSPLSMRLPAAQGIVPAQDDKSDFQV